MAIDGRKIYEVYNRQTGGLLARGSVAECARELGITPSGFRAAIRSQRKYAIRHVETVRKIYSVYDDHAGLISQGSLHKVAEEMGYSESTVERWGRIGNTPGMTVMVTEKLEPTKNASAGMTEKWWEYERSNIYSGRDHC